jgi:hypothetical protein
MVKTMSSVKEQRDFSIVLSVVITNHSGNALINMEKIIKEKLPNWKVDLGFAAAILLFAAWVESWLVLFNLILS